MNRKVLVIAVAFMAVAMLVTPVMAIGPYGALGKNPKFWVDPTGGLQLSRGEKGGFTIWVAETEGDFWMEWRWYNASSGGGKANNAIQATIETVGVFEDDEDAYADGLPTVNENKWIYMSPEGSGNQFRAPFNASNPGPWLLGSHGMIWWMFFFIVVGSSGNVPLAVNIANNVAATYPEGAYWSYNFIG